MHGTLQQSGRKIDKKFLSWSFIANFFHAKESFEQIDNGGMLM